MADSREKILGRLRTARRPFGDVRQAERYLPMVPVAQSSPAELRSRFIEEAEKLSCVIHEATGQEDAYKHLFDILGDDRRVASWDQSSLPLGNFNETLQRRGIQISRPDDPDVRVGITGVDALLASTGSLVLSSGKGRYRTPSLLPLVHIAVVREAQILPNLETWVAHRRAAGLDKMRSSSNIIIISGPSRTADIAMELVRGMHGPRELHIILLSA